MIQSFHRMRFLTSRLLSSILGLAMAFPPSVFAAGVRLALPPMEGLSGGKARGALIQELRASDRVSVLEESTVDAYLRGKKSGDVQTATLTQAKDWLKSGTALYRQTRMKEAIDALEKSRREFRKNIRADGALDGLKATSFFISLALLAEKQRDKARSEMMSMLTIAPDRYTREFDPKLFPRDVRMLIDEARGQLSAIDSGEIEIVSQPTGAVVMVDGGAEGTSPAVVKKLPPGEHYVKVEQEGFETYFESVQVASGANRLPVELRTKAVTDLRGMFAPTPSTTDLPTRRTSFLDQMGVDLGADVVVFLEAGTSVVRGQLYDLRSQSRSQIQEGASAPELSSRLLRQLDDSGYVSAAQPEPERAPELAAEPNLSPPSQGTLEAQSQSPLLKPNRPKGDQDWYENLWLWAGIGGGLLLAGGAVFLLTDLGKSAATNSTLTIAIPGR